MKTFLKAFPALWRQAPLWRACSVIGAGGLAMAAFFPTAGLKKHAHWLPGAPPHASHPPAGAGPDGDSGREGSAHGGSAGGVPVDLQYPSMAEVVRGHIVLAGHDLPLPAGDWHPILSAQISNDFPFSFLTLVRTRQGAITGLIIAQATQQPIPLGRSGNITSICHDDRNYLNHSLPLNPAGEDCIGTNIIAVQGSDISTNPLINQSIARLQALGVTPIPPLFLGVQWRHVAAMADGQVQVGVLDALLPPLDKETHQLLAPPGAWEKGNMAATPVVRNFLNRIHSWALAWQTALRLGFDNQPQEQPLMRDPEAP